MSKWWKTLVAAILAFLVAAFTWYVAWSDGDETTKPDSQAVYNAGKTVYDAATAPKDGAPASTVEVK